MVLATGVDVGVAVNVSVGDDAIVTVAAVVGIVEVTVRGSVPNVFASVLAVRVRVSSDASLTLTLPSALRIPIALTLPLALDGLTVLGLQKDGR